MQSHQSREEDRQRRNDCPAGGASAAHVDDPMEVAVDAILLASVPLRMDERPYDNARQVVSLLCEASEAFPFDISQDTPSTSLRVDRPRRIHAGGFGPQSADLVCAPSQEEELFDDPRGRVLQTLSTIGRTTNIRQRWTEVSDAGSASRMALFRLY